jgi:hypothetical protein
MVSVVQPARRIVVNSDPTAMVEKARPSRTPRACLVKPVAARRDFLGPRGIPQFGASVFNLQPRAGQVEPRRAQGWAHERPWRTQTVIDSRSWTAGGLALLILCSSQATGVPRL